MKRRFISLAVLFTMVFSIGLATVEDTYAMNKTQRWYHTDDSSGVPVTLTGYHSDIDGGLSITFKVSHTTTVNCGSKFKEIINKVIITCIGARSTGNIGVCWEKTYEAKVNDKEHQCVLTIDEGVVGLIQSYNIQILTTIVTDKGSFTIRVPDSEKY